MESSNAFEFFSLFFFFHFSFIIHLCIQGLVHFSPLPPPPPLPPTPLFFVFELRTWHLLGRWVTLPVLFVLVTLFVFIYFILVLAVFEIGSWFIPGPAWTTILFVFPCVAVLTGIHHCHWLRWRLLNFFVEQWSFQVARITDVSHFICAFIVCF
jgi:hypothetical protein